MRAEQRADRGVVMDDVDIRQGPVGRLDLDGLVHRVVELLDGVLEDPRTVHVTTGLADGEQLDVVSGVTQAAGKVVDDSLSAAVTRGRDRDPRTRDQTDTHDSSFPAQPASGLLVGAHGRQGFAVIGAGTRPLKHWGSRRLAPMDSPGTASADRAQHHDQAAGVPTGAVSYTHLRAHETVLDLVCRLLLEKKKKK